MFKLSFPALILLAAVSSAQAPPPAVGEVHLDDRLSAAGERRMAFIKTYTVSFSPDSNRLAIEFADASSQYIRYVNPPPPRRFLLIVPVADPAAPGFWLDVSKIDRGSDVGYTALSWSPDGSLLGYANTLIHLPGGETCRTEGTFGGFFGPAAGLVSSKPTAFGLVDADCHLTEQWTTRQPASVEAISSDGKRVALLESTEKDGRTLSSRLVLADPRKRPDLDRGQKIRLSPSTGLYLNTGGSVFVDDAVCRMERSGATTVSQLSPEKLTEIYARAMRIVCWDKEGKPLRHYGPNWTPGSLSPLTTGGGRVAIADNGEVNIAPVHSIWDFRSGKMIAQWSPETDEGKGAGRGWPLGFAISPDGKLVAEARSDRVLIFRLP